MKSGIQDRKYIIMSPDMTSHYVMWGQDVWQRDVCLLNSVGKIIDRCRSFLGPGHLRRIKGDIYQWVRDADEV